MYIYKIIIIFCNTFFVLLWHLRRFRLKERKYIGRLRQLFKPFPPVLSLSKDVIELMGIVVETFPNAMFKVRITSVPALGHELLCHLAGRMRVHRVRILPGDKVRVEMTPYDLKKGRIVYRFRSDQPVPESEGSAEQKVKESGV